MVEATGVARIVQQPQVTAAASLESMPSLVVLDTPADGAPQLWFQPRRLSTSAPGASDPAVVPREDVMRATTADTSLLTLVPEMSGVPSDVPMPDVVKEAEAAVLTPSGEAAAALPGDAVAAFTGWHGCMERGHSCVNCCSAIFY